MGWWWSFAVIDKPSAVQRYPPGSFIHSLFGCWRLVRRLQDIVSTIVGFAKFSSKKSIFAFIYLLGLWLPALLACLAHSNSAILQFRHSAIPEYRVRSENRRCLRQDEDISITTVARCYSYCLYE